MGQGRIDGYQAGMNPLLNPTSGAAGNAEQLDAITELPGQGDVE